MVCLGFGGVLFLEGSPYGPPMGFHIIGVSGEGYPAKVGVVYFTVKAPPVDFNHVAIFKKRVH